MVVWEVYAVEAAEGVRRDSAADPVGMESMSSSSKVVVMVGGSSVGMCV